MSLKVLIKRFIVYVDACFVGVSIDDLFLAPEYSNKFTSEKVGRLY